jgi:anti-sigma B factor antagonist
MENLAFRVTREERTLRLAGELDMATAPLLKSALAGLPSEGPVSLDLSELTFLDSSGLNVLAQYGNSLNGQGPLVLANVPDPIVSVLEVVGFDALETIVIRR